MMEATVPQAGHLTHLGLLRFTGADAASFLQGQLTNDLKLLTSTSVMLAAYLNPQGRVLALLRLLPHSSGTLAMLPRELKQAIADRMRKYVLRAKVKIDDPGESLVVLGCHGTEALAQAGLPVPGAGEAYVEKDGIGVARIGQSPRYWIVAPPGVRLDGLNPGAAQAGAAQAGAASEGAARAEGSRFEKNWRLADIQAGLPQVYGVTSEAFVAQMLNLDLLDGISFSKGCYTGQEIVARTQHLGRIKRRLFHLRLPPATGVPAVGGPGAWRIGAEISLSDGRRGRLTEVVDVEDGTEVLAVLTLEPQAAPDTPSADQPGEAAAPAAILTAAVQVPLPYPLV